MPKLSLWRPEKGKDYKFFDRTISEQYTVGATDLYIHKYIGSNNPVNSKDITQPHYDKLDPTNIQDLFWLENRDRKYDPNIYRLRGHYNVQNLDFDLSQFGLFLTNDIIFVTVHYNDMIDIIGRKLMVGDVFELPHLTDYHPLNETIPIGLRRYYQITDANFASEGFSQTWYPHLWRIKCEPLIDSQEFANILQQPINTDNYLGDWDPTKPYEPGYTVTYGDKIYTPKKPVPPGVLPTDPEYWELSKEQSLQDIIATYKKNLDINDKNIEEAARLVPEIGYDRKQLYIVPTYDNNEPAPPINLIVPAGAPTYPNSFVINVSSAQYRTSSVALRIPQSQLEFFNSIQAPTPNPAHLISLQVAETSPQRTDTGSGPVYGDLVLTASTLGEVITSPYGTADNTYATADQFVNTIATFYDTRVKSSVVTIVETINNNFAVDLLVRATVFSENGTPQSVWPEGTRIVSIDPLTNSFVTSNPTTTDVPAGTRLEIAYDFTGVVKPTMDYRADCDPRFLFIKRYSPRSFGYAAAYDSGNSEFPNGEAAGAGTTFPANPQVGDYFIRLDYLPQQLFRWDGRLWVEISRNVRTTPGFTKTDQSQLSTFINNDARVPTSTGQTIPSRQSLSNALKIKPD